VHHYRNNRQCGVNSETAHQGNMQLSVIIYSSVHHYRSNRQCGVNWETENHHHHHHSLL